MGDELMDVLGRFVQRSHYSAGQLAALSGVPKRTIRNWLNGRVRKPHRWRGLVDVAAALRLTAVETDQLLQFADHPPLAELREQTLAPSDRDALRPWPPETDAPFQAIPDLPYFVGREAALADLQTRLRDGETVSICNLQGMGGVGKTALAAHLAYELRPFFPDGVLWARLDTTDTMSILSDFAAAYDEDVSERRTIESRSAAVRAILADKRALIVLDNAETSGQVRPLLPPTVGETAVIITTRNDLAVTDGLHHAAVLPFDPAQQEALALFTHLLGEQRVQQERDDLCAIAELLGQLPLALAIAAGRLRGMETAVYYQQLEQADKRLDALVREDRSVRLTFDVSYMALPLELQTFFAALGTFGGDDFGITAVAHVTETNEAMAKAYLDELVGLSLVQVGRNGRYQLHSLLKDYAQTHIPSNDSWRRMVDHFVQFVHEYTNDFHLITPELGNILAALDTTLTHGWTESYLTGVAQITFYLDAKGLYDLAQTYLETAVQQAKSEEYNKSLAAILVQQGNIANKLGEYSQSTQILQQSIALAEKSDARKIIISAHTIIGGNQWVVGDLKAAEAQWQMALELAENDNPYGSSVAALYVNLAMISGDTGQIDKAKALYNKAAHIVKKIDVDPRFRQNIFNNMGALAEKTGNYVQAKEYFQQAVEIATKNDIPARLASSLIGLGEVYDWCGNFEQAMGYFQSAIDIARTINSPLQLSYALVGLGRVACELPDLARAQECLQEGVPLSRQTNLHEPLGFGLLGLGRLRILAGDYEQAENYYQQAVQLGHMIEFKRLLCDALLHQADLHLLQDQFQDARTTFNEAATVGETLQYKFALAWTLFGSAQATAVSNPTQSRQYAEESHTILQKMGHYKTAVVEEWLNTTVKRESDEEIK